MSRDGRAARPRPVGDEDGLPLPPYAHRPGVTERHDEGVFAPVRALLADVTDDAGAAANAPWRHGVRLLNEGFGWEAHEVLEAVWLRAAPNSRERHLVRAVIQLANGELKRSAGRHRAAARLGALALEAATRAFPAARDERLMGLSRDALEDACRRLSSGGREDGPPRALELRFDA